MIKVVTNASLVAASFTAHGAGIDLKAEAVVRHHAMLLQTRVRANASGRPGPRAPTGDYRRSIARRVEKFPGTTVGQVGTNAPQGRRLEFGFVGVDSLGRYYDQPPYAHFGPALDAIQPGFLKALEKIAGGD